MNEEILLMQRLFDRYKISSPLDPDIQKYSLRSKGKNFHSILIKLGLHSTLYSAVVFIYFLFKKLGIGLSVAQSAAVLFVAAAVTAAGIMAGGIISVKKIIDTPIMKEGAGDRASGDSAGGNGEIGFKRKQIDISEDVNSIVFLGITGKGVDKVLIDQLSGIIIGQVVQARGGGFIRSDAGFALSGSVEKIGGLYLLSVRLINRMNRRIIYASSEEAVTPEELKAAAKKISLELTGRI